MPIGRKTKVAAMDGSGRDADAQTHPLRQHKAHAHAARRSGLPVPSYPPAPPRCAPRLRRQNCTDERLMPAELDGISTSAQRTESAKAHMKAQGTDESPSPTTKVLDPDPRHRGPKILISSSSLSHPVSRIAHPPPADPHPTPLSLCLYSLILVPVRSSSWPRRITSSALSRAPSAPLCIRTPPPLLPSSASHPHTFSAHPHSHMQAPP
ncbi:hypothetical protein K438DRAFT_1749382 [Mycena galopus ATCC 62051]|nr:hypothetical protein K438DRAFT_1749382 [Mycena galopus ATCC 62051]